MTEPVVIDASVLLAIALPDPQAKAKEFFELIGEIGAQHVIDIRDAETLFVDAMAMGCGSYDAAYVRAALDNGAQLATLDKKLIPHLIQSGIARWMP